MSRKWSRMVQKNTRVTNQQRKKSGLGYISDNTSSSDGAVTFKGRSWILPMLLVATGVFCFITFRGMAGQDQMYWITGASYIVLALLIFWVRRPYLSISQDEIKSRRFGGDRRVAASDIQEITLSKDAILIAMKSKRTQWAFSKVYHQFPVETAGPKLREFAERHSIKIVQ